MMMVMAFGVQLLEQGSSTSPLRLSRAPVGLLGEDDVAAIDQRSRHAHALLLAARQGVGPVRHALAQP